MSVLDLTALQHTVDSCHQKVVDADLPHQLSLHWMRRKSAVQGRCNCGVTFAVRRPEVDGSLAATLAEYEQHVRWVTR